MRGRRGTAKGIGLRLYKIPVQAAAERARRWDVAAEGASQDRRRSWKRLSDPQPGKHGGCGD